MKKQLFLLFILLSLTVFTTQGNTLHTRTIRGIVTDIYGEAYIGVNIQLKGTTTGTITGLDGDFELQISSSHLSPVLVVSYIGYITQEVPITENSFYSIQLQEEYQMLEEVVVAGYGVQKKASITGSVSSVNRQNITKVKDNEKTATTWKRSGMKDNSLRLQVGDNDFIPAEAIQIAVQIDGFRVRVVMDCFFFNNKGEGLEGTFKLKLPTDATPFYFAFGETEYINTDEDDKKNSRKIPYTGYKPESFNLTYQDIREQSDIRYWESIKEARIVSKQKAAKAYEQTVSASVDPALMEWGGADMFSCRVYPLSGNTLHRIVVGYDLNMTEALDFREYILSIPQAEKEVRLDMMVYDSPTLVSSVTPSLPTISGEENRKYYSITNPSQKEYVIQYDTTEPVLLVQVNEFNDEDTHIPEEAIDIPYFAGTYRVDLPEKLQENLPEDAVFVLDISLSSNPDKFNVWLTLLEEILDKNQDIIRNFALLTFNIENRWYNRHFLKNNYYNREQLFNYLNTLALEGATDLSSALKEASNPSWLKKRKSLPKHIFLLSDADCNWGETNMHTFRHILSDGDRVHTYKTGLSGTNTAILNYISRISNGFAFTVTGEEEAKITARSFRYKPWNIDHIEVGGTEDFLISGQPIQLYNGQKLIFTGRDIPTGEIWIDVNDGTEKRRLYYHAKETIVSPLVSRIYGQVATSCLENYGFYTEEAAINYSTYYRIPGQYTSFLMLESEWDYDRYGIDDSDAISFVEDNMVNQILEKLSNNIDEELLGEGKADFVRWLEKLKEELLSYTDDEFDEFLEALPEQVFTVRLPSYTYHVQTTEQQSYDEQELLGDEDIRYDNIFKLSRRRNQQYGKPDGLKLLSSVIERNAGDFQAIRDVALTAIEWDLSEPAYYMMRRIIDWRQEEGLAYLTAAEALSKAGYVELALIYYYITIEADWDYDYGSLSTMAAFKCVRYINSLYADQKIKLSRPVRKFLVYLQERALEKLDDEGFDKEDANEADIVIMVSWNINDTDIDLHVVEPTGERCYYGNNETEIGGKLSIDVTDGYGPEMYILKKAVRGKYSIMLNYYSDSGLQTASKAKAYIEIYRNWGRKNEKRIYRVAELKRFNNGWDDDEKIDKHKVAMSFTIR